MNYLNQLHVYEEENVQRIMKEKHSRWLARLIEARKKEDAARFRGKRYYEE